ncbi:MAG: acyloxyacyl hydrolase [Acidobacteriota bacterium]
MRVKKLVLCACMLASFPHLALGHDSKTQLSPKSARHLKADFNRAIFYRNKLEFSYEVGWLPYNIPLIFDVFLGSPYTTWPLKYTLVPNIASLRWQVDGIHGPWILRGSTDFTFSGSFTAIPRGAETRYTAFDFGIRRNFIPHNWRVIPYYEMRGGVGNIDAKGPKGVDYAQGQDLTFTYMTGSGVRYDFNPKYSLEVGATYMHVSNAFLSEPKYQDFGINVWGPIVGFNVRLGAPKE